MKRTSILALLAALLLLPAVALARRGGDDHGLRHHDNKVGRIASFDAKTGELVLKTRRGGERSALVTDDTRIQCSGKRSASASRNGGDDAPGDDNGGQGGRGGDDAPGDDNGGQGGRSGDDDPATHDVGDDNGTDDPATHDAGDDNGTDDPATHDAGDDHGGAKGDDDSACDEGDLTEGRLVRRARIDTSGDDAVWTRIKLARR